MWQRRSIEKFLADRKVPADKVEEIKARIDEVADERGEFIAACLDRVMGDAELAREYERAYETDPSLRAPSFE